MRKMHFIMKILVIFTGRSTDILRPAKPITITLSE